MLKLLKSLKAHKAPGPDQISPRVLKEMANVIAPILTTIFRKSYDSVVAKILRLHHTQKLNNYMGSDMRGDRQFELSLLID